MNTNPNSQKLIQSYLDVVNKTLTTNRDQFPWKQIVDKGEREWHGKNIGIGINNPNDDTPEVHTLEFRKGQFVYLGPGKVNTAYTWEADRQFMQHVVDNPQEYYDNPLKLNWDWMKSSLNIGDRDVETPGMGAGR